jgi:hypothetical protein
MASLGMNIRSGSPGRGVDERLRNARLDNLKTYLAFEGNYSLILTDTVPLFPMTCRYAAIVGS